MNTPGTARYTSIARRSRDGTAVTSAAAVVPAGVHAGGPPPAAVRPAATRHLRRDVRTRPARSAPAAAQRQHRGGQRMACRRGALRVPSAGIHASTSPIATTANGRLAQSTPRQDSHCTSNPPSAGASAGTSSATSRMRRVSAPRWSGVQCRYAAACATESAGHRPIPSRRQPSQPIPGAAPASAAATANNSNAASSKRRSPQRSQPGRQRNHHAQAQHIGGAHQARVLTSACSSAANAG